MLLYHQVLSILFMFVFVTFFFFFIRSLCSDTGKKWHLMLWCVCADVHLCEMISYENIVYVAKKIFITKQCTHKHFIGWLLMCMHDKKIKCKINWQALEIINGQLVLVLINFYYKIQLTKHIFSIDYNQQRWNSI